MIRPSRLFPLLGLLALAVAVPATAGAVPRSDRHAGGGEGLRPFDAREGRQAPVPSSVRQAARDARRALGRQGFVQLDEQSGSPKSVVRTDGYLTGATRRDAAAVALAYVRGHATLFGLSDAEVDDLQVTRRYTVDGVTHLQWRQVHDGIPVLDQGLQAAVDSHGRLATIGGAPLRSTSIPSTAPGLSAGQALAAARRDTSASMIAPRAGGTAGPTRATTFANGDTASLVIFGDPRGNRLAWRLLVHKSSTEVYDAVVDANTGRILRRNNMVKFANADVWDYAPDAGAPGGTHHTWAVDPWLKPGETHLNGPNAHVVSDLDDHIWGPGPGHNLIFSTDEISAATDFPGQVGLTLGAGNPFYCPTSGCSWNPQQTDKTQPDSWSRNLRQNAAQVFYFLNKYHDHLAAAPINFGNAPDTASQSAPAGTGGFNVDDPVIAQIDDGASTASGLPDADHVNNANMATYPDGTPGYMQMYLWKSGPGGPWSAVNGGDDAAIVYHEYTHGLSSRLVTSADGYPALSSAQAGAMGEAWSDFYALDYLASGPQPSITDTPAPGDVKMGMYEDGGTDLLRTEALDCRPGQPTACPGNGMPGPGGYTYGDFGKILGTPEVHADGEIWAQTLWQIREALGSTLTEKLVTHGLRLLPPEPSMLDARNAILMADTADEVGANHVTLWAIFAERGMGYFASTRGGWDTRPVEDTHLPPSGATSTVSGIVTDERTNAPISGAFVSIGGHETYLPPAEDSFFAQTDASGSYTLSSVPNGTYPALLARAAGYSRAEQSLTVSGPGTHDLALTRNWSSTPGGATVSAFTGPNYGGCGPAQAADQDQGTTWSTDVAGGPKSVTIQLPDTVNMSAYAVDPGAGCGDDDRSSAKGFTLAVSSDGSTFAQVDSGSFTAADNHRLTRRPLSQIQTQVRYVRLTISSAQGSTSNFMDVSDIEVYGAPYGGPTVTTGGASGLSSDAATIAGTIDSLGLPTSYHFEWGTTTGYGHATPDGSVTANADSASTVTAATTGLAPATTYHYRLVAQSSAGSTVGSDRTLTTESTAPPGGGGGGTPPPGDTTLPPPPGPDPGGGGGGGTPPPGDTTPPPPAPGTVSRSVAQIGRDVTLFKATSRGVTVSSGGVATLGVSFPSEIVSQTATATLTVSGSGARAAKTTTIGTVRFKVRNGKAVSIRVKLTKSGRKLLARRKRLTVRLRLTVKDSLGRRIVVTRTVKLTAKAQRRRRR